MTRRLQQIRRLPRVGVGQLEDPAELTGMAHCTEHMLFLGTEKYPAEGEYGTFVKSNGSSANAYTTSDHTNYPFEIRHEALDDALDTLTQDELVALLHAVLAGADARQRLVLLNAPAHTLSAATPTFTDRTDWKTTRQYE